MILADTRTQQRIVYLVTHTRTRKVYAVEARATWDADGITDLALTKGAGPLDPTQRHNIVAAPFNWDNIDGTVTAILAAMDQYRWVKVDETWRD